jgi:hypothetical protein
MVTATVRGLWKGAPIKQTITFDLDRRLEEQHKRVVAIVVGNVDPYELAPQPLNVESAADFALRMGFTKFDYLYEQDGSQVIVDVLDPSKAI